MHFSYGYAHFSTKSSQNLSGKRPRNFQIRTDNCARTIYAGLSKITGYADLAGMAGARKASAETAPSTTEATRVFGESIVRGVLQKLH